MSQKICFVKISTKVPTAYREELFRDFDATRTTIYGVRMFRFTGPRCGAMVVVLDLHHVASCENGEFGLLSIEEEYVEVVDSVPYFPRNRLLVAMSVWRDACLQVTRLGSTIHVDDIEVQFLEAAYNAFVDEVERSISECATQDLKDHLWLLEEQRLVEARKLLRSARENRRGFLCNKLREYKDAMVEAEENVRARQQRLLKCLEPLYEFRTRERCEVSLMFEMDDGSAVVEYIDKLVLKLHDSRLTIFGANLASTFTVINTTIKHKQAIVDLLRLLYFRTMPTSVRSLAEILPLIKALECSILFKDCIEHFCAITTHVDFVTVSVTSQVLGSPCNERLVQHTKKLLRQLLAANRSLRVSLAPLLAVRNLKGASVNV